MIGLIETAAPEWNSFAVITFGGSCDTRIKTGEDYGTLTLGEIFTMEPGSKAKGSGRSFIPSTYRDFDGRSHSVQREQGRFVALCCDIDHGDHPLERVRSNVEAFGAGHAWLIYSSAHARPGDMRWRVVLPFVQPLTFADWRDAQQALFGFFEKRGIVVDRSLGRAGQPVYLPNVPATHAKSGTALRGVDGRPLYYQSCTSGLAAPALQPASQPLRSGVSAIRRKRAADDAERGRIRHEAEQRRVDRPGDDGDLITAFNKANSVGKVLKLCGYDQCLSNAADWRSPNQTSETFATRVMGEKWVSLSGSDAAAGVGRPCDAGRYGDAYDLLVHYKHAGNHRAAFRDLRTQQTLGSTSPRRAA